MQLVFVGFAIVTNEICRTPIWYIFGVANVGYVWGNCELPHSLHACTLGSVAARGGHGIEWQLEKFLRNYEMKWQSPVCIVRRNAQVSHEVSDGYCWGA